LFLWNNILGFLTCPFILHVPVIIYHSGSRVVSLMTDAYSEQAVSGFRTLEGIWREFLGPHVSDVYLRDRTLVEAEECVLELVAYLIDSMDFTGLGVGHTSETMKNNEELTIKQP